MRKHGVLEQSPLTSAWLAGLAAGVVRGCLESPADLVKTRLQLGIPWWNGSFAQGFCSTCARTGCCIGTFWCVFEASREMRAALPPVVSDFAAGGLCSVFAWAVIFPVDTIKSRIQGGGPEASGMCKQASAILTRSGPLGFYAGFGPGLLR
eukprot:CAMPEP_0194493234 /NCGR_PEP_ID=MMETSP0253-20130528/11517_1 /TAXON_ID=2966 /ORGANISM="Noctiluca scintillans" /LENGTH=150 /DNA_ID=CAMNT_0039334193 /DNA_START=203 /DNA_END=651 /DNA_ORIENTATION=-